MLVHVFWIPHLATLQILNILQAVIVLANKNIYEEFMMISKIIVEIWANFDFAYMHGDNLIT